MIDSRVIDSALTEIINTYIPIGVFGNDTINVQRIYNRIYGGYGERNYVTYKPIGLRESFEDRGLNKSISSESSNKLLWDVYKGYDSVIRRWIGGYILFTDKFILNTEGEFFCKPEDTSEIWEELQKFLPKEEDIPKINYITTTNGGLSTTPITLRTYDNLDIKLNYNNDLNLDRINEIIKEKRSSLMILHGEPGTGKTSLLRHIIKENSNINFYWLDSKLLQLSTSKQFFDFILDNKDAVYILEDCEHLLRDREEGQNGLLSTVLNISDGMLGDSLNVKFICTFNADLDRIDKALLRKGRLRLKYEFKKLTVDKVNALSKHLGIDIPEVKEMPLCDIYNYYDENGVKNPEIKRVGFN